MKKSITLKIFAVMTGLFLFALMLQWLFVGYFFNRLYGSNISATMHSELQKVTESFQEAGAQAYYRPFEDYSLATGSPVLVLREDYRFGDIGFLSKLTTIQGVMDEQTITIPASFVNRLNAKALTELSPGDTISGKFVRVGNTNVYEPLLLVIDDVSYSNRVSMRTYTIERQDIEIVQSTVRVISRNLYSSDKSTQNRHAELLYEKTKDCLITQDHLSDCVFELKENNQQPEGSAYTFILDSQIHNDMCYYFLTVHDVIITGYESAYISKVFSGTSIILALILMIGAYVLAKTISKPMQNLSMVTTKIAQLDFSEAATYTGQDEIGQLSQNINQMAASLEQTMGELKAANRRLEESSVHAQKNEERMKKLLGDVSHEFKTPLALIGGYADVLRRGLNEREPNYYLDIIIDETENLSDMVSEAIELTRLQSGQWSNHIDEYSAEDIVEGVLRKFERRLHNLNFTVTAKLCDAIVNADARRIDHVLSNFISNAIKYSDDRKLLTVTMEKMKGNLQITIGNSGTISENILHTIWNRNFTVDEMTQARLPSQGIGLDIAKAILDAHGSQYAVEVKDSMVYFSFTLPIAF